MFYQRCFIVHIFFSWESGTSLAKDFRVVSRSSSSSFVRLLLHTTHDCSKTLRQKSFHRCTISLLLQPNPQTDMCICICWFTFFTSILVFPTNQVCLLPLLQGLNRLNLQKRLNWLIRLKSPYRLNIRIILNILNRLNRLNTLNIPNWLSRLNRLNKLNKLNGLNRPIRRSTINILNKLNWIHSLKRMNELNILNRLNGLNILKRLNILNRLNRLHRMNILNGLTRLNSLYIKNTSIILNLLNRLNKLNRLNGQKKYWID